jgi:benzoyl-CoA-dihydrodiol lyase
MTLHVDFQTSPADYRHWRLAVDGNAATLTMDVAEDGGIVPGYKLKLNSYDLGVDIELADALNRIRFEHPRVQVVVLTGGKERIFCSGANIFMLGQSSHAWKVNFCKFTNETRNGMEDSSRHSGIKFIAAVNGACAGGGYELALACDEILLVDDRSSAVSLPEVPLLGVLPGTGGLTRLTDKRHVRHDLADLFCTTTEGVRGQRAKAWRLVDEIAKPGQFAGLVAARSHALAAESRRPDAAVGVTLTALQRTIGADSLHYSHVSVHWDTASRQAVLTIRAPTAAPPTNLADIRQQGIDWWPLATVRELDDAILWMRANTPQIGTWILKTSGATSHAMAADESLRAHQHDWFVTETIGWWRRCLARLDVSSRSLFALIEPESCFVGVLLELALAADRSYMLALPDEANRAPTLTLTASNFGLFPMVNNASRLSRRFYDEAVPMATVRALIAQDLDAAAAMAVGLVTAIPDDIDWTDEIRLALEERASLSPDALTGLEANLRFGGAETMATRIFARLTAWQNWIFNRPNAVGEKGALKVYGKGEKARFDWDRV